MDVEAIGTSQSSPPSPVEPSQQSDAGPPTVEASLTSTTRTVTKSAQPSSPSSSAAPPPPPQSPIQHSKPSAMSLQSTPPRHNKSWATRKNKINFSLQVPLASIPVEQKVTSMVKLEAYHQSLSKVIEVLTKIDDTLVLWPYKLPNSPESDLLNNPLALGDSIHQIQKFFDKFRINKELSRCYVNCLVSFDMDYDHFMESAMVMLQDVPARMYKRTLQVPHIALLGWLFGTHEDISIPVFEQVLNTTIASLAPNQVPMIQLGLSFKPIWDGTYKKKQDKNQDKDQTHSKWAIHIEAIAEIALTSKAFLKKALLSSEVRAHTNLPLLLVLVLQKKTPVSKAEEIKRAIVRHSTVLQSISKSFSSKILSLNRPLPALQNATLRTTLMAVTNTVGKNSSFWLTPPGTAKGIQYLTPQSTRLRQVIMSNISQRTWLTPMEMKCSIGLCWMPSLRHKRWNGIKTNSSPSLRTALPSASCFSP